MSVTITIPPTQIYSFTGQRSYGDLSSNPINASLTTASLALPIVWGKTGSLPSVNTLGDLIKIMPQLGTSVTSSYTYSGSMVNNGQINTYRTFVCASGGTVNDSVDCDSRLQIYVQVNSNDSAGNLAPGCYCNSYGSQGANCASGQCGTTTTTSPSPCCCGFSQVTSLNQQTIQLIPGQLNYPSSIRIQSYINSRDGNPCTVGPNQRIPSSDNIQGQGLLSFTLNVSYTITINFQGLCSNQTTAQGICRSYCGSSDRAGGGQPLVEVCDNWVAGYCPTVFSQPWNPNLPDDRFCSCLRTAIYDPFVPPSPSCFDATCVQYGYWTANARLVAQNCGIYCGTIINCRNANKCEVDNNQFMVSCGNEEAEKTDSAIFYSTVLLFIILTLVVIGLMIASAL